MLNKKSTKKRVRKGSMKSSRKSSRKQSRKSSRKSSRKAIKKISSRKSSRKVIKKISSRKSSRKTSKKTSSRKGSRKLSRKAIKKISSRKGSRKSLINKRLSRKVSSKKKVIMKMGLFDSNKYYLPNFKPDENGVRRCKRYKSKKECEKGINEFHKDNAIKCTRSINRCKKDRDYIKENENNPHDSLDKTPAYLCKWSIKEDIPGKSEVYANMDKCEEDVSKDHQKLGLGCNYNQEKYNKECEEKFKEKTGKDKDSSISKKKAADEDKTFREAKIKDRMSNKLITEEDIQKIASFKLTNLSILQKNIFNRFSIEDMQNINKNNKNKKEDYILPRDFLIVTDAELQKKLSREEYVRKLIKENKKLIITKGKRYLDVNEVIKCAKDDKCDFVTENGNLSILTKQHIKDIEILMNCKKDPKCNYTQKTGEEKQKMEKVFQDKTNIKKFEDNEMTEFLNGTRHFPEIITEAEYNFCKPKIN